MSKVAIDAIIKKMRQGLTEPYLCMADDQKTYVVKGSNATNAGLVKELLVAYLGTAFGLPIPPFSIAWLDDMLVEYGPFDIDAGYCFASEYQTNIQEITYNQLGLVKGNLLCDLFVFDYWIKNNDRTLTITGGNANFFFDQVTQNVFVLDHNLAFANDFNIEQHINQHVGSMKWNGLDLVDRQAYEVRFEKALKVVNNAISEIPEEWLESYPVATIEEEIITVLNDYKNEKFWEGIK